MRTAWMGWLAIGWLAAGSPASAERLYGLERMERLDLAPRLLEGTRVRQVSSHDRTGGNDDGFNGTYSALYVDGNGEYVLFDEIGAGCVYRIWMTYGSSPADYDQGRLKFYFDGESSPRLDVTISNLFDGAGAPFEYPLVGDFLKSSHGCYCYLPFPYRERLKITLDRQPYFHQITYHVFDASNGVVSWTGSEDRSAVLAQWNAVGEDPKPTNGNVSVSGTLSLAPGATGTLYAVQGATGVVQGIEIDPSPASESTLSNVWLRMVWDDRVEGANVPIGDFFGSGKQEFAVGSLPIGMRTAGFWYCYFPMPYWRSARLQLINAGSESVQVPFDVRYSTNGYPREKTGYFFAEFHEASFGDDGRDVNFVDVRGRGHLVGLSLFMKSSGAGGYRDMNYLEGDERAYVDGSRSPCIYGTGTEDYFNAGWYFNKGFFNRPYHGHPWHDQFNVDSPNYTQAYRFHLGDVVPFERSLRFGMEHGSENHAPGTYSSVAYYYAKSASEAGLSPAVAMDAGDAWSEASAGYEATPTNGLETSILAYEGDDDDVMIEDAGYVYSSGTTVRITVPTLPGCRGLLLRRRADRKGGGLRAAVFVDGARVGTWYDPDENFGSTDVRWVDAEFMVPAAFVAGTSSVLLEIVPEGSASWSECAYRIHALRSEESVEDVDGDGMADAWERATVASLDVLSAAGDFDADGLSDVDEYVAGSDPTDASSTPSAIEFVPGGGVEFRSLADRAYALRVCTDLRSNVWAVARDEIPGTGTNLVVPVSASAPAAFYRLEVERP